MSYWNSVNYENKKIISSTDKPFYLKNTTDISDDFKIVMILDESGSMETIRDQIIKSINDLITEQKQIKERPATFTLVKFNDYVNKVMVNKPLSNVNNLTRYDYIPNGSTALYDAIGETINWFNEKTNLLMIIVTDGQENASKKFTRNQINKMIDDKKTNNDWTYVYLSSDLNTELQGNNIGLKQSKYASNCQVAQSNFGNFIGDSLNKAISNCRRYGVSIQEQI
jgi:uncharacterized protein YegL